MDRLKVNGKFLTAPVETYPMSLGIQCMDDRFLAILLVFGILSVVVVMYGVRVCLLMTVN